MKRHEGLVEWICGIIAAVAGVLTIAGADEYSRLITGLQWMALSGILLILSTKADRAESYEEPEMIPKRSIEDAERWAQELRDYRHRWDGGDPEGDYPDDVCLDCGVSVHDPMSGHPCPVRAVEHARSLAEEVVSLQEWKAEAERRLLDAGIGCPEGWMLELYDGGEWGFCNFFRRESDAESARMELPYLNRETRLVPTYRAVGPDDDMTLLRKIRKQAEIRGDGRPLSPVWAAIHAVTAYSVGHDDREPVGFMRYTGENAVTTGATLEDLRIGDSVVVAADGLAIAKVDDLHPLHAVYRAIPERFVRKAEPNDVRTGIIAGVAFGAEGTSYDVVQYKSPPGFGSLIVQEHDFADGCHCVHCGTNANDAVDQVCKPRRKEGAG